jgi:biofilm PGA synthesis lipoprotein PgaB
LKSHLIVVIIFVGIYVFPAQSRDFLALCYHDVRDDVAGQYDPDTNAVSTYQLFRHFAWFKDHGFHPVSVDQILKAKSGDLPLPEKALLLTFDDGLKSFYTRVFPILKLFNYPAVLALEISWLELKPGEHLNYGEKKLERKDFLTWDEILEMKSSGLVEVASHSYNLHRGILSNPQGNKQPAATSREYFPEKQRYEKDEEYEERIHKDLLKSVTILKDKIGQKPRVMIWPFGRCNKRIIEISKRVGMGITLTLIHKKNNLDCLEDIGRILIFQNPSVEDLNWDLVNWEHRDPQRMIQVDLDYIYDPDENQMKKNLDILLDRVKEMKINVVYLQAFSDIDGDGVAEALYFPNRHMDIKADLFNRVAWQLKTRSEVQVYAWMPVMAFKLNKKGQNLPVYVEESKDDSTSMTSKYLRLSIFDPKNRSVIFEIFEDLAKYANFEGVLFHDDAYLSDFEDASPPAKQCYRQEWKLPEDINDIRVNPNTFKEWTKKKATFIVDFTVKIKERMEKYRYPLLTARNIYARPVLEDQATNWFAQSFPEFLNSYDFTVIMAMPYLEKVKKKFKWLKGLVKKAKVLDDKLRKTIFELQSRDWEKKQLISTSEMVKMMEILQLNGAMNYGYYPDDFIKNHPELEKIRKGISLQTYPYGRK